MQKRCSSPPESSGDSAKLPRMCPEFLQTVQLLLVCAAFGELAAMRMRGSNVSFRMLPDELHRARAASFGGGGPSRDLRCVGRQICRRARRASSRCRKAR